MSALRKIVNSVRNSALQNGGKNMIRKLNITLAILCVIGAIFVGSMLAYEHFSDVSNGKVAHQVESGV